MPGDLLKHGFSQGCPGCIYAHFGVIGRPKRNHSEDCRIIMDEEIGKDKSDTRADKVKKRQDHFNAQRVEQHERDGHLRKLDVIEPENVDEDMHGAVDEEELSDAPAIKTDVRLNLRRGERPLGEVQLDMMKNRVVKGLLLRRLRWRMIMEFMSTRWPLEKNISVYVTTPS